MTDRRTYTEEEVSRIVEFNGAVERLRERSISAMNLSIQRSRAAGDSETTTKSLIWVLNGIETLIADFIANAQNPPEKPEEPAEEPEDAAD